MTAAAVIVVVAVVAAVVAAIVLGVLLTRRAPAAPARDPELVEAIEEIRRQLSESREEAERERRRGRLYGELSGSMDLEDIMDRVVHSALDLPSFDAGMMIVDSHTGAPSIVQRGMTENERARPPSSGVATLPGTVTVTYRYGGETEPTGDLIRGGVFIPLMGRELRPIGTLSLFWRRTHLEPSQEDIELAETLAAASVPQIENARRYHETRELAETDAITGLYNKRYFDETLRREVMRAQRYERRLALMVFDIDDFKDINTRLGHPGADRLLAQAAQRLREAVRNVDIPCRTGGDEFGVILPESSADDAELLFRRLKDSMRGTVVGTDNERLLFSAGIAELQHGDTAASLLERADAALYRAKDLGKDRSETDR